MMKTTPTSTGKYQEVQDYIRQLRFEKNRDSQIELIQRLWDLADDDEIKLIFMESSFHALELMIQFIKVEDYDLTRVALGCLWFVSRARENEGIMMDREYGLAGILMNLIKAQTPHRKVCLNILRNCSFHPNSHSYLLEPGVGYAEYLRRLIFDNPNSLWPYRSFSAISNRLNNTYFDVLCAYDIPRLLANQLIKSGSDPNLWLGQFGGAEDFLLSFFVNISGLRKGAIILREMNLKSYWIDLFHHSKNMEIIRVFCILTNIYGDDDEVYHSIYSNETLDLFIRVYKGTLDSEGNIANELMYHNDFEFGLFLLRDLTCFLRNFALYFSEKALPCQELDLRTDEITPSLYILSIGSLLYTTVHNIIENGHDISYRDDVALQVVGGGADDFDTLDNCIETLLQFLFHFNLLSKEEEEKSRDEENIMSKNKSNKLRYRIYLMDCMDFLPDQDGSGELGSFPQLLSKLVNVGPSRGIWQTTLIKAKIILDTLIRCGLYSEEDDLF